MPVTLVSIVVTPANITLGLGRTQQYLATGVYSDSSSADISSLVSWSSSIPLIASISGGGVATAQTFSSMGTVISATLGAVSGSTNLFTTTAFLTQIPRFRYFTTPASMFYINTARNITDRYDIAKFAEFVNPYSDVGVFDILCSYFFLKMPQILEGGELQVAGQENRSDLASYDIYTDTQQYWIVLNYNGLTDNDDIKSGMTLRYPLLADLETLYFQLVSLQRQ